MKRRDFLKLTGLTGTVVASGCAEEPTRRLIPFLNPPEDIIPGKATWFATTCRQRPAGCGMLAKNRETRIVKFEGNPAHPVNQGKLCARGQSALQDLYSPDRIASPALREGGKQRQTGWQEAADTFRSEVGKAGGRVAVLSGVEQGYGADLLEGWLKGIGPERVLYYETTSRSPTTPSGREIGSSSVGMSCSPTTSRAATFFFRSARNPKGKKAGFIYVGPRLSLTGASSDRWVAIRPGAEADSAFAILASLLEMGFDRNRAADERSRIAGVLSGRKAKDLASRAGLDPSLVEKVAKRIAGSGRPFVLAGGYADAVVAANLINRLAGSVESCMDFSRPLAVSRAARQSEVRDWLDRIRSGDIRLLLIHRSKPVYSLPGFAQAIEKVPFTVVLDSTASETTAASQLVLPIISPYESWDAYMPRAGLIGCMQPTMGQANTAEGLEKAWKLSVLVIDKQGTATKGDYEVLHAEALGGGSAAEVLSQAAAAEEGPDHPVARAIRRHAARVGAEAKGSVRAEEFPGLGIKGVCGGEPILVGNHAWMVSEGVDVPLSCKESSLKAVDRGQTVVFLSVAGTVRGVIRLGDALRTDMLRAVKDLKARGLEVHLVSGDTEGATGYVAGLLGVDRYRGGVLPADKVEWVCHLRRAGHRVGMVGDGANDAAALAVADVGFATGDALTVTKNASDLTILSFSGGRLLSALDLSRLTSRTVTTNLCLALVYNLVALPAALAGLVNPVIAVTAMLLSSLTVVGNSARIARQAPRERLEGEVPV